MSDELTDHKIAVSEARTETKFVRLEGKIDLLSASINSLGIKIDGQRADAIANKNVLIAVIIGSTLTMTALIYAILTYGASTFYNGTVVRDIVHSEISVTQQKPSNK